MITGLTRAEAAYLVQANRCACGSNLVDSWGGSFGYDAPVVRCLKDLNHKTIF